jgi:tetratricopeptide (TPR) repeat protein
VRITAQLVSAADGYHVWSQTYDRELNDIFAIQTEISNAIADALQLRLTAHQKLAAELAPPTRNLDAYQAYLLGRYELAKYQRRSIALAVQYFREAIALDPEFADAYAVLSMALRQTKYHPNAPDPGRREYEEFVQTIVMPVLSRAQALGPDRPEVLAATAWLASRDGDLERALEYYDRALAQMPTMAVG